MSSIGNTKIKRGNKEGQSAERCARNRIWRSEQDSATCQLCFLGQPVMRTIKLHRKHESAWAMWTYVLHKLRDSEKSGGASRVKCGKHLDGWGEGTHTYMCAHTFSSAVFFVALLPKVKEDHIIDLSVRPCVTSKFTSVSTLTPSG